MKTFESTPNTPNRRQKYVVLVVATLVLSTYFLLPKATSPARAELVTEMGTITAEATAGGVLLEWDSTDDDAIIEVVRDGEVVVTDFGSGSTVDKGQASNDFADYTIEWRRDLTSGEINRIDDDSARKEASQNPDEYEHIFIAPLSLDDFGSGSLSEDEANAVAVPDWTKFRFTTFIPSKWVDAPPIACAPIFGTYDFRGDNRDWDATSADYRTRMNVNIDWLDSGATSVAKGVGPTKRYELLSDGSHRFDAEDTAATSGMKLIVHSSSSNSSNFTLRHDVTNPLCNPNMTLGIWFEYDFDVWRNGNYAVSGETRKVPHQELYTRNEIDTSWSTIWRHGYLGFSCLASTEYNDDGCYATHFTIAN